MACGLNWFHGLVTKSKSMEAYNMRRENGWDTPGNDASGPKRYRRASRAVGPACALLDDLMPMTDGILERTRHWNR